MREIASQNEKLKNENGALERRFEEITSRLNDSQQSSLREKSSLQERLKESEEEVSDYCVD